MLPAGSHACGYAGQTGAVNTLLPAVRHPARRHRRARVPGAWNTQPGSTDERADLAQDPAAAYRAAAADCPLRHSIPGLTANLIDNAVRHNDPGGWIRARIIQHGSAARLLVENGGPILDSAKVATLSQPFRGQAPTAPDQLPGPAWGYPSPKRSRRRMAGHCTCTPARRAACARSSTCPPQPAPEAQLSLPRPETPGEGLDRRGRPAAG